MLEQYKKDKMLLRPIYFTVTCDSCDAHVVNGNPAHENLCPDSKYVWFFDRISHECYPDKQYSKKGVADA